MKRTHRKDIYFTEEEWEYITKCAEKSGMKVGTYIQTMAVHGQVINYDFGGNKVSKQMYNALNEFNKIGTNINQIAHKVNTTSKVYQSDMNMLKKRFNQFETEYINLIRNVEEYMSIFSEATKEFLKKRV